MMNTTDTTANRGRSRRLTLPEGREYVPMFGYDSDGELVLISPSRKQSIVGGSQTSSKVSVRGLGATDPQRKESAANSHGRKSSLISNRSILPSERVEEMRVGSVDVLVDEASPETPKNQPDSESSPSDHDFQSVAAAVAPPSLVATEASQSFPTSGEDLAARLDNLELTRDNLTGMTVDSSPPGSAALDGSPRMSSADASLTDDDIASAETARSHHHTTDISDGAHPSRRDSTDISDGAHPSRQHSTDISDGAHPSRRHSTDISDGAHPSRRDSTDISDGAHPSRRHTTDVSDGAHPTRVSLSLDGNSQVETTRKSLTERDEEFKKVLENLRRSLAQPDDGKSYRKTVRESTTPKMLMQSDSDSRKEDEDSSGPDDESEAWIDGRVEEQAPTVTDDILIDPDPSRESEVRSFEKELALEEAILQELTPLKREGPDEPLTRAAPKTSVRQLMQDIENARELTRRVEVARRWSAMNERTTPVKVRSPLRPTVHVASVGADWSALMETTNASQSEICRTCGSPVASAVNIPVVEKSSHRGLLYSRSDTSPGANGIDKKPYTPPLPSPSTGAGRDAPYVWPVSRKTPMLSREDPIEEPSSPKLYLPVPTIPLPTGSTLPQSGFYTGSYGRVVSSSVASPPPRRTEDRSTGDCPVTVSTAETQTNPMELTTTREFAEPRLEAAASRTTDYDTPYHEVLRDRLWRSAAHVTGGHDREELVLVDGKIVSYNRESDPPVGHGGRTRQSTTGESRHTALSSTNESVVSGPSVQPKVTTVRGNDHLVYAYRARVTACDWRAAGSFLRAGIGNSEDVLWGEPITTRIKWEVDDVITVVGVARPAPREIVVRLNDNFILARTTTGDFPFPDDDSLDLIPYIHLGSGVSSVVFL